MNDKGKRPAQGGYEDQEVIDLTSTVESTQRSYPSSPKPNESQVIIITSDSDSEDEASPQTCTPAARGYTTSDLTSSTSTEKKYIPRILLRGSEKISEPVGTNKRPLLLGSSSEDDMPSQSRSSVIKKWRNSKENQHEDTNFPGRKLGQRVRKAGGPLHQLQTEHAERNHISMFEDDVRAKKTVTTVVKNRKQTAKPKPTEASFILQDKPENRAKHRILRFDPKHHCTISECFFARELFSILKDQNDKNKPHMAWASPHVKVRISAGAQVNQDFQSPRNPTQPIAMDKKSPLARYRVTRVGTPKTQVPPVRRGPPPFRGASAAVYEQHLIPETDAVFSKGSLQRAELAARREFDSRSTGARASGGRGPSSAHRFISSSSNLANAQDRLESIQILQKTMPKDIKFAVHRHHSHLLDFFENEIGHNRKPTMLAYRSVVDVLFHPETHPALVQRAFTCLGQVAEYHAERANDFVDWTEDSRLETYRNSIEQGTSPASGVDRVHRRKFGSLDKRFGRLWSCIRGLRYYDNASMPPIVHMQQFLDHALTICCRQYIAVLSQGGSPRECLWEAVLREGQEDRIHTDEVRSGVSCIIDLYKDLIVRSCETIARKSNAEDSDAQNEEPEESSIDPENPTSTWLDYHQKDDDDVSERSCRLYARAFCLAFHCIDKRPISLSRDHYVQEDWSRFGRDHIRSVYEQHLSYISARPIEEGNQRFRFGLAHRKFVETIPCPHLRLLICDMRLSSLAHALPPSTTSSRRQSTSSHEPVATWLDPEIIISEPSFTKLYKLVPALINYFGRESPNQLHEVVWLTHICLRELFMGICTHDDPLVSMFDQDEEHVISKSKSQYPATDVSGHSEHSNIFTPVNSQQSHISECCDRALPTPRRDSDIRELRRIATRTDRKSLCCWRGLRTAVEGAYAVSGTEPSIDERMSEELLVFCEELMHFTVGRSNL
eukprot:Clim_evm16s168 gene=Clim_evmTU16s168